MPEARHRNTVSRFRRTPPPSRSRGVDRAVPDKAQHLLEQVTMHLAVLELRLAADPEFRCLCADHGEALEALGRWEASTDPQRTSRIEEFRRLVAELEQEIMAELGVT